MRKMLILGAALLAAAPLAAQPGRYDERPVTRAPADGEDWGQEDFGRGAPPVLDPRQMQAMAGAIDRLLGAVMDLPIGGIAAAVDPHNRGGYHPGATVRDMATRDDPHAEARMRAGIHGATRGIGAMSQALTRVMPVLERSLAEVGREIEAAIDAADLGPR